ncbi:MAG TPA: hypothetical protein VKG25_24525, partial [Bryobacteraceae bacterium]|nr:hypothetical protein [Bryobacteraceae bacterium]
MAQALAQFEGGGEALAGEFGLAEALVGDAAEVQTVGFSPCVTAIGFFREIERFAGVLQRFVRVAHDEAGFGEGEPEVDGIFSETAGIGQEDTGLGFLNGLRVVSEMPLDFAGCVEGTELEFDLSRAVGE